MQSSGISTNHISVTGSRGNLTSTTTYVTPTATLVRTFKNYDTGLVYQSQDVNGQWTTYTYGACASAFLTNVAMPLSLSRQTTWNCTGGVVTTSTNENGQVSRINYTTDAYFWRPENTKDQLSNTANLSYATPTQSRSHLDFNGTTPVSTIDVTTTLDSLGRSLFSQRRQGPSSSNYDTVQQTYDSFRRPYQITVPYVATTTTNPTPPVGTPVSTTYYDALGRTIKTIDAGGGRVNTTYNQNDVLQEVAPAPTAPPAPTAENTKQKQLEYDALGRLRSVCEITSETNYSGTCAQTNSQTGYLTKYDYDLAPNYNSLKVTQSSQRGAPQTRIYIYDMLGRLTSETNPETANLAYTYVYDSDATCGTSKGDVVKRTDAKSNVTCYAYDALHRLASVTYPSGPNSANTAKKYFVYDTATVNGQTMTNAKGRLAEAYTCTTCPGTKITDFGYKYSARGEVTDLYESTAHSGGYYHLTASYFPHGALNSVGGVPGLPTIYYGGNADPTGLDGEGRYVKVTASSGANPVTGVTYTDGGSTNPIGSLAQVTFGSGDYDTFSYDPNTGRMTQYKFIIGATPQTVQGDLTWNANGTLAKLQTTDPFNSANNLTCTFGHDDLARINSANCGTAWSQAFSLDPFGNASKTGTITFNPGFDLTKNWFLPTTGFDNNGNLLTDVAHAYTWDAENKLTAVDSVNLAFDALGRMVEQARGSSYTQIIYSPTGYKFALMNGQTLQKAFCPLPGGGAAVYGSSGTIAYYRHSDWLGSSRFASTPSRTKYFDLNYAPYGEDFADSGTTDLNFSGQNQDTVAGLYDFLFREYSPTSGRWIQPDPVGLKAVSMASPQTWNRYTYVGNGPLDTVDRLGLLGPRGDVRGGEGSCFEGPLCAYSAYGSPTYLVNGQHVSAGVANSLLSMGAATDCQQCQPGQTVGMDNKIYQYQWIDSYTTTYGSVTNTDCSENAGICSGDILMVQTRGHYGLVASGSISGGGEEDHPGLAAFYDNRDCPTCGQTLRHAAGSMNKLTAAYAIGFATLAGGAALSSLEWVDIAVGPGNPFHVAFGVDGTWLHATGDFFEMEITGDQAAAFARMSWFQFSVPVLNSQAVLSTAGAAASTCVTGACYAVLQGWTH